MASFLTIAFSIICAIESCNGKYMVNKQDPTCVGWTGMRPIAVEDCNRIVKENRYTLADRYNKAKCAEMFEILVTKYLPANPSMEQIARLWCRGRRKMYAPETPEVLEYLNRVKAEERKYAVTTLAGTDTTRNAGEDS